MGRVKRLPYLDDYLFSYRLLALYWIITRVVERSTSGLAFHPISLLTLKGWFVLDFVDNVAGRITSKYDFIKLCMF